MIQLYNLTNTGDKIMIKHIIFDLDGTLIYSHEGIFNSIEYALNIMNITVPSNKILMKFIGPPLEYSFTNFCGLTDEQCKEAVSLFRKRYSKKGIYECKLIPGTFEMLSKLKEYGNNLYIATSKPKEYTVEILKALNIYHFFSYIGAAPLAENLRDKTTIINLVKKTSNIENCNMVIMVGDRKEDAVGAQNTNIRFIGVKYGYSEDKEFESFNVEKSPPSVEELNKYLINI